MKPAVQCKKGQSGDVIKKFIVSAFVFVSIVYLSGNGNGGDASPEALYPVKANFREKTIDVKVIEGSDAPLIDRNHAGSADNGSGYENGYTLHYDGKYHMLITEMFTNGGFAGYWTPARIGYWIYCSRLKKLDFPLAGQFR